MIEKLLKLKEKAAEILAKVEYTFGNWVHYPATWYQFWLPQSGYAGGVIAGLVLSLPVHAIGAWLLF